jgi:hypothetical protein
MTAPPTDPASSLTLAVDAYNAVHHLVDRCDELEDLVCELETALLDRGGANDDAVVLGQAVIERCRAGRNLRRTDEVRRATKGRTPVQADPSVPSDT